MNISSVSDRLAFYCATVAAVEELTSDARLLTLDVSDTAREHFAFVPGQHLTLRAVVDGQEVRRNYSICSTPSQRQLQIAYRDVPGGTFTTRVLAGAEVGDVIETSPPIGRFCHQPDPGTARRYVAIAAGSGITPVLSMVRSVLEAEPGSAVTLVYLNARARTVMFIEQLAALKNTFGPRLQIDYVMSREPQGSALLDGRLDGEKLDLIMADVGGGGAVAEWFVCGPAELIDDVQQALHARSVAPERVHCEPFYAAAAVTRRARPAHEIAGGVSIDARLGGRETNVVAEADETILDAVLRVRPEAPFACRGGMCGTCRALCTAGEVESLTDAALEPGEVAAGFILTCQSYARGSAVTVDFDAWHGA